MCSDFNRSSKGRKRLCFSDMDDYGSDQSDKIYRYVAIRCWIGKQTESDQKIIILSGSGYTQKEIGEELGIAQSYISGRITKLRVSFRSEI